MEARKYMAIDRFKRIEKQISNFNKSICEVKKLLDSLHLKGNYLFNRLLDFVECDNYRKEQNKINPFLEDITDVLAVLKSEIKRILGAEYSCDENECIKDVCKVKSSVNSETVNLDMQYISPSRSVSSNNLVYDKPHKNISPREIDNNNILQNKVANNEMTNYDKHSNNFYTSSDNKPKKLNKSLECILLEEIATKCKREMADDYAIMDISLNNDNKSSTMYYKDSMHHQKNTKTKNKKNIDNSVFDQNENELLGLKGCKNKGRFFAKDVKNQCEEFEANLTQDKNYHTKRLGKNHHNSANNEIYSSNYNNGQYFSKENISYLPPQNLNNYDESELYTQQEQKFYDNLPYPSSNHNSNLFKNNFIFGVSEVSKLEENLGVSELENNSQNSNAITNLFANNYNSSPQISLMQDKFEDLIQPTNHNNNEFVNFSADAYILSSQENFSDTDILSNKISKNNTISTEEYNFKSSVNDLLKKEGPQIMNELDTSNNMLKLNETNYSGHSSLVSDNIPIVPRYLIKEKSIKGRITILQTPWCFWFTPIEAFQYLENIPTQISEYFKHTNKKKIWKTKPDIGMLVSAKFLKSWYRAIVISKRTYIQENKKLFKYSVYYFDYGNCKELELCYIRPLPLELYKYPIATFCCCLLNVIPTFNASEWTNTANQEFSQMVLKGPNDLSDPTVILEPFRSELCPLIFSTINISKSGITYDISRELLKKEIAEYGDNSNILSWYENNFAMKMMLPSFSLNNSDCNKILTNKQLLNLHCPLFDNILDHNFYITSKNMLKCDINAFTKPKIIGRILNITDDLLYMFTTYIDTPNSFWVYSHLYSEDFLKYDKLLEELTVYLNVEKYNPNSEDINLNVCYAIQDKEGNYHRGIILEKTVDTEYSFKVEYIDDGGIFVVDSTSIFTIPDYFVTSLPRMAIKCCLYYLNGVQDWKSDSTKYFKKFMLDDNKPKGLTCYYGKNYSINDNIEPSENEPLSLLILQEKKIFLNDVLLEINNGSNKHDCIIELKEDNEIENYDPMGVDFKSLENNYAVNYEDSNVATLNYKNKTDSTICFYYRLGKKCLREENCKYQHIKQGEHVPMASPIYSIDHYRLMVLPETGSYLLIQVTNIVSPKHFYAHMPYGNSSFSNFNEWETICNSDAAQKVSHFKYKINEIYKKKVFSDRDLYYPALGELLVSKSAVNKSWCRSLIKEIYDTSVLVFHVDYGNIETIQMTDLREIERGFLDFEYLAFEGHLRIEPPDDIAINCWTEEALNCFESLIKSQLLIVQILDRSYVQMYTTEKLDIAKYLIDEKLAKNLEIHFNCNNFIDLNVPG